MNVFKSIRKEIKLNKKIIYFNIKYNFSELLLYYSAFIIPRYFSVCFFTIFKKYINTNDNNKDIPRKSCFLIKYSNLPLFYN